MNVRRGSFALAATGLFGCGLLIGLPDPARDDSIGTDAAQATDAGRSDAAQDSAPPQPDSATDAGVDSGIVTLVPGIAPFDVSVDDQYVYWADVQNENVGRASKVNGTGVTSLASGISTIGSPTALVVDDANVYVASSYGILRCAKLGCADAPTLVAPGNTDVVLHVAVDATNVYWTERSDSTLYSAPKLGSNAVPVAVTTLSGTPTTLVVQNGNVYAAIGAADDASAGSGGVDVVDLATKTRTTLAADPAAVVGLALGAVAGFYNDYGEAGALRTVPLDGGGMPAVLAGSLNWPTRVAVDATSAFWIEEGVDFNVDCAIVACALSSCVPHAIARAQMRTYAIAIDDAFVYWANEGESMSNSAGAIMRAPK